MHFTLYALHTPIQLTLYALNTPIQRTLYALNTSLYALNASSQRTLYANNMYVNAHRMPFQSTHTVCPSNQLTPYALSINTHLMLFLPSYDAA